MEAFTPASALLGGVLIGGVLNCPGPAITSLVGGHVEPLVFVAAMLAGMSLYERVLAPVSDRAHVADAGTRRRTTARPRHLATMERRRS